MRTVDNIDLAVQYRKSVDWKSAVLCTRRLSDLVEIDTDVRIAPEPRVVCISMPDESYKMPKIWNN